MTGSGAPGSSRSQSEATQEILVIMRNCEPATSTAPEIASILLFTRVSLI